MGRLLLKLPEKQAQDREAAIEEITQSLARYLANSSD